MKRHFITDETDSYTTDRLIATLCLSYFKRLNEDRSTHLIIIPLLTESAWMGPLWKEETELISPQVGNTSSIVCVCHDEHLTNPELKQR